MMPTIVDELDLLEALVPLAGARIVEAGCGAARLARDLLARYPSAEIVGLEVDERQHAKNLAAPAERLQFLRAGAEAMPFADASFDGALMLKSLHHVPLARMDAALAELARVLRPGGWLYVSEPVYAGPLNDVVRLYNDEGEVRAAAQAALDRALDPAQGGAAGRPAWVSLAERRFEMPAAFGGIDDFERRMMYPTFADHRIDEALRQRVHAALRPHLRPDGLHFVRPMHVRVLQRAR
jgi:ubiquinone/menaquinone biosynthesis C-methylase UbiE